MTTTNFAIGDRVTANTGDGLVTGVVVDLAPVSHARGLANGVWTHIPYSSPMVTIRRDDGSQTDCQQAATVKLTEAQIARMRA